MSYIKVSGNIKQLLISHFRESCDENPPQSAACGIASLLPSGDHDAYSFSPNMNLTEDLKMRRSGLSLGFLTNTFEKPTPRMGSMFTKLFATWIQSFGSID